MTGRDSGPDRGLRAGCWPAAGAALRPRCGDGPAGECQTDLRMRRRDLPAWPATCVARHGAPQRSGRWTWCPSPQSPLATREWPGVHRSPAMPASLMVDRKVGMATTLTRSYADARTTATSVHLVLAVPSSDPGAAQAAVRGRRGQRRDEHPLRGHAGGARAAAGYRGPAVGGAPGAAGAPMCPWQLDVTVEATSTLALPGTEDTLVLQGMLQTAEGAPGDRLRGPGGAGRTPGQQPGAHGRRRDGSCCACSEAWRRQAAGPAAGGAGAGRCHAAPPHPAGRRYRQVRRTSAACDCRVPAAVPVVVPVVDEASGAAVVGATVQVQTMVPAAMGGEARYVRTAQTGSDGRATLPLLPARGAR